MKNHHSIINCMLLWQNIQCCQHTCFTLLPTSSWLVSSSISSMLSGWSSPSWCRALMCRTILANTPKRYDELPVIVLYLKGNINNQLFSLIMVLFVTDNLVKEMKCKWNRLVPQTQCWSLFCWMQSSPLTNVSLFDRLGEPEGNSVGALWHWCTWHWRKHSSKQ